MGYELSLELAGGRIEIEADTPKQLEKRVRALDLRALEAAITQARKGTRTPRRPKTR